MKFLFLLTSLTFFGNSGCHQVDIANNTFDKPEPVEIVPKDFAAYWYAGQAEVNSYKLQQSRYGQIREGDAVMVFVAEDFSKSKQVKLDYPNKAPRDAVSVLKLNQMKRFHTGIYDYSVMLSAFTPIDMENHPNTLKATFSSQDWCGQVFSQMNLKDNGAYELTSFSYFESEGDGAQKFKGAMLEDEIWSRIRINPESVPTGEVMLIPSMSFGRLQHKSMKPASARITFVKETESTSDLKIEYLHHERTVTITFENTFPFKILGWKEKNGNEPATVATLHKTLKSSYWGKNSNNSEILRDSLGLKF